MDRQKVLNKIAQDIKEHTCSLRAGCIQPVPGDGSPYSDIVFIGEGPGRFEDKQGKPFVGPAGRLLSEMLESIKLNREDVFITNINRCRPPSNRDPSPSEIAEHSEFLERELKLIKPKLIVLLGRFALNQFFPDKQISKCHGKAYRKDNQVYFSIYHPAAALHNPNLGNVLREEFKRIPSILKKIDELSPQTSNIHSLVEEIKQEQLF